MYLGVDVGGTKIKLARFGASYELVDLKICPTADFQPGNAQFIDRLFAYILQHTQTADCLVGLAMKGLSHDGILKYGSLVGGAIDFDLRGRLSQALGRKVLVNNDRRPLALAEKRFGCAQDANVFTVVNLGTGCGIAHFESRLLYGCASLSGELFPLRQWVPQIGAYETVNNLLGGAGVANLYQRLGDGKRLSTTEIFARSHSDAVAGRVIEIFIDQLATLLETISYFYNPELIVLNGSLIRSSEIFFEQMCALYRGRTFAFCMAPRIELSKLEHANCLGAVCEA